MKRLCQWPYLVIAILVFVVVNDQGTNSQQIKIVNSPDQPQLTLTSVKSGDGHKLRLNIGEMVLETGEFRALHNDGSITLVSARNGRVRIAYKQSTIEASKISLALDNGLLTKERKAYFAK